ncbi:hypothetical protein C8Q80DRAFT_1211970 [Daedaleopsis nitida]|nr:hypothetical protein C8Q80DRAFT_1211970 [Daedaleopsis nitida]
MLRARIWSRLARIATCVSSGTIQAALDFKSGDEYVETTSTEVSSKYESSVSDCEDSSSSDAPVAGRGIQFPIELWRVIFEMAGEDANKDTTRDMLSILYTCTSFKLEVENVLYRRVSLTRNVSQLHAFCSSISQGPWRAAAVQSLRLYMPDLRQEDDTVRGLLQKLVNLDDLHVQGLGNPQAIFVDSPFQLRTCRINWDAFLDIHVVDEDVPEPLPESEHTNPPPLVKRAFLTPLKTLTLTRPTSHIWEDTHTLFRNCRSYNITHLNLVLVPSRSIPITALRVLGEQLVSFRMSLGRAGWGSTSAMYQALSLWPTRLLHDVSLPHLKHLEIGEELPRAHYDPAADKTRDQLMEAEKWSESCPAIETFIWRPGQYHASLAAGEGESWYFYALHDFGKALFKEWPTLDRFERLRLKGEMDHGEDGAAAAPYIALVRRDDGRVAESAPVYDDELWRRA